MSRVGDSLLDRSARGVVTYAITANAASYQQDGLMSYRGWQYAAWYRADRRAVVARRRLPRGAWQRVTLGYRLFADDSHDAISMGVTPSDGRLHLAFGTHTNAIRYARSRRSVASRPAQVEWSSRAFGGTRDSLPGAPRAPTSFTYPQFETVRGRTMLTYRDGSTHDGRQLLLRYDDRPAGTWTLLGRFTDSRGTWRSRYGTSTSRYSYLHGFTANPVDGDLEVALTWREQPTSWCAPAGAGNHDLGYARSPDGGLTWLNGDGAPIGRTGGRDTIAVTDPQLAVRQPIDRGLINQETQAVDSRGRIHVVTSMVPDVDAPLVGGCVDRLYEQRARYARPYHSWRDADGRWRTLLLPTRMGGAGRSKLAFDRRDDAYLVLPDGRVVAASAASGWTDWRTLLGADRIDLVGDLLAPGRPPSGWPALFGQRGLDVVGEPIVDRQRLRPDGVLSVAYQEPPIAPGAPSAFRVADLRLGRSGPRGR